MDPKLIALFNKGDLTIQELTNALHWKEGVINSSGQIVFQYPGNNNLIKIDGNGKGYWESFDGKEKVGVQFKISPQGHSSSWSITANQPSSTAPSTPSAAAPATTTTTTHFNNQIDPKNHPKTYKDQNYGTLVYAGTDINGDLVYSNDNHNMVVFDGKNGKSMGSYNKEWLSNGGQLMSTPPNGTYSTSDATKTMQAQQTKSATAPGGLPSGAVPDPGHPGHYLYGSKGGGDTTNGKMESEVLDSKGKVLGIDYKVYSDGKEYDYGVDYGGTKPPAGTHEDANGHMVIPGVTDKQGGNNGGDAPGGLPSGAVPDPGHPGHYLYGGKGGGGTTNGEMETEVLDAKGKVLGTDYTIYSDGKKYNYGVDYGDTTPPAGVHEDASGHMIIPGVTDKQAQHTSPASAQIPVRDADTTSMVTDHPSASIPVRTPAGSSYAGFPAASSSSTVYGSDEFNHSGAVADSSKFGQPSITGARHTFERADPDLAATTSYNDSSQPPVTGSYSAFPSDPSGGTSYSAFPSDPSGGVSTGTSYSAFPTGPSGSSSTGTSYSAFPTSPSGGTGTSYSAFPTNPSGGTSGTSYSAFPTAPTPVSSNTPTTIAVTTPAASVTPSQMEAANNYASIANAKSQDLMAPATAYTPPPSTPAPTPTPAPGIVLPPTSPNDVTAGNSLTSFNVSSHTNTPPRSSGGCFTGDTMVMTLNGEKPIKDIVEGDEVVVMNLRHGKLNTAKVSEKKVHENEPTVWLETTGSKVATTADHRFWTGHDWLPAGKLEPGSTIFDKDGELQEVVSVKPGPSETVYNLHVDSPEHNFFANGLLAHNIKFAGF